MNSSVSRLLLDILAMFGDILRHREGDMQSRCERLKHLRSLSDSKEERMLCETCPLPSCIYEKPLKPRPSPPVITERYAQCTKCQATETLYFTGNSLQTTIRWHQVGNSILHNCGQAKLFPPTNTRL